MTLRTRLQGLAAVVVIAALLGGVPWLLLQLGGPPWPPRLTPDGALRALTSPDDGTLAVAVIKGIAWLAWAGLVLVILVELLARLRRIEPPHLRGLALPQHWARRLVATAALLFVAGSQASNPLAASANPPVAIRATPTPGEDRGGPDTGQQAESVVMQRYTVKPGDTLWQIAQNHLGDGSRFGELVALNAHLLDHGADFLRPGWILTLPGDANTVIVTPGDTLSALARTHLGDETKAHQIFDASRQLLQPDGRHLTDPDLIFPGWRLHLTSSVTGAGAAAEPRTPTAPNAPTTTQPGRSKTPADAEASPQPRPDATPPASAKAPAPNVAEITDTAAAPSHEQPSWLLLGLTGAGVLLAGALFRALRQRRAAQFRARRPGRTIARLPEELIAVEKSLLSVGAAATPTVEAVDGVLRNLAASTVAAGHPAPSIAAVELAPGHLLVHLTEPDSLPAPWQGDGTGTHWQLDGADVATLAAGADPDQAAPYPQLVAIGSTDDGTIWLFNAEEFGALTLTGDDTFAADFARYLIAEFTLNPWTRDLSIDCIGLGHELAGLHPHRLTIHDNEMVLTDARGHAQATLDDLQAEHQHSAAQARVTIAGDQLWPSRVVIAARFAHEPAAALADLTVTNPGRTATSVVLAGALPAAVITGLELRLTQTGRLEVPLLGLDLIAVGLTSAEAEGCAALLLACDDLADAPVPTMPSDSPVGWRQTCNQAGQLLPAMTLPREPDSVLADEAGAVLPAPDEDYLECSATTAEDLETLAPRVSAEIRDDVARLDPDLDADADAWFAEACVLPRLTLLGPVTLRLGAGGKASAAVRRKAFYVEMAAYLAMHPEGVSSEQLADAMATSLDRIRKDVSVLRDWLGSDPTTGRLHVPDSLRSPAAQQRGRRLYQLEGVLVDADLFRRLRVRGESRGPDGIDDLRLALRLVQGRPFDQLRSSGGAWLAGEQRHDHYLAAGIVDVAHLVALDAIVTSDYAHARAAAEIAALAAPYDEVPRLDLVAIASREGRFNEADRILRHDVCNRSDDGEAPTELSERTSRIINSHAWLKGRQAAS